MTKSQPPLCGVNDCEKESEYLLTCGDRCREHGIEDQPETVAYLEWASV